MKRVKRVCVLFACVVLSLMVAACGGSKDKGAANASTGEGSTQPVGEKRIESFYYEYGSDDMGYFTYSIMPQKDMDSVLVTLSSRTDPDKDVEQSVSSTLIDDLDKLIADNKLSEWDGFDESAGSGVDGYSFQLTISYENGDSIAAQGFEDYPVSQEDYQAKHEAILALLDAAVQQPQTTGQ